MRGKNMAKYKYQLIENAEESKLRDLYSGGYLEKVDYESAESFSDFPKLYEKLENNPADGEALDVKQIQELKSRGIEFEEEIPENDDSFLDDREEDEIEQEVINDLKKLHVIDENADKEAIEKAKKTTFILKIPEVLTIQEQKIRQFLTKKGISNDKLFIVDNMTQDAMQLPENWPLVLDREKSLVGMDRKGIPHLVEISENEKLTERTLSRVKVKNGHLDKNHLLNQIGYETKDSGLEESFKRYRFDSLGEKAFVATIIAIYHPELVFDLENEHALDTMFGEELNDINEIFSTSYKGKDREKIIEDLINDYTKELRKKIPEKKDVKGIDNNEKLSGTYALNSLIECFRKAASYDKKDDIPESLVTQDEREYEKNVIKNTRIFKRIQNAKFKWPVDKTISGGFAYADPLLAGEMLKREYPRAEKDYIKGICQAWINSKDKSPEMKEMKNCMKDLSGYCDQHPDGEFEENIMRQKLETLKKTYTEYSAKNQEVGKDLKDVELLLRVGKKKYNAVWDEEKKNVEPKKEEPKKEEPKESSLEGNRKLVSDLLNELKEADPAYIVSSTEFKMLKKALQSAASAENKDFEKKMRVAYIWANEYILEKAASPVTDYGKKRLNIARKIRNCLGDKMQGKDRYYQLAEAFDFYRAPEQVGTEGHEDALAKKHKEEAEKFVRQDLLGKRNEEVKNEDENKEYLYMLSAFMIAENKLADYGNSSHNRKIAFGEAVKMAQMLQQQCETGKEMDYQYMCEQTKKINKNQSTGNRKKHSPEDMAEQAAVARQVAKEIVMYARSSKINGPETDRTLRDRMVRVSLEKAKKQVSKEIKRFHKTKTVEQQKTSEEIHQPHL